MVFVTVKRRRGYRDISGAHAAAALRRYGLVAGLGGVYEGVRGGRRVALYVYRWAGGRWVIDWRATVAHVLEGRELIADRS